MSASHAGFTIERRYRSSPSRTFAAFADPALKRRWFANPANRPDGGEWELDFRVGGGEVNVGGSPDGPPHIFRSRFHDIVAEERIVYTYDLFYGERLVSVSVATVEFHPDGGGTRLVLHEDGVFLGDADDPAAREHGTGKLLDALGAFLAVPANDDESEEWK